MVTRLAQRFRLNFSNWLVEGILGASQFKLARADLCFVACRQARNAHLILARFTFFKLARHKTPINNTIITMSDDDEVIVTDDETEDPRDEEWLPRRSLRDTNWMYRVDSLRVHDHREMESLLSQALASLYNAVRALTYAMSVRYSSIGRFINGLAERSQDMYDELIQTVHVMHSMAYCFFIDFLPIMIRNFLLLVTIT